MALNFTASTHRVNHGSGTSLDDLSAFTWAFWVKVTTLTTLRYICAKGATTTKYLRLSGTGGNVDFLVDRATTDAQYITNDTPLSSTGSWKFIAVTYDAAATSSMHIYVGSLSSALVERLPT